MISPDSAGIYLDGKPIEKSLIVRLRTPLFQEVNTKAEIALQSQVKMAPDESWSADLITRTMIPEEPRSQFLIETYKYSPISMVMKFDADIVSPGEAGEVIPHINHLGDASINRIRG